MTSASAGVHSVISLPRSNQTPPDRFQTTDSCCTTAVSLPRLRLGPSARVRHTLGLIAPHTRHRRLVTRSRRLEGKKLLADCESLSQQEMQLDTLDASKDEPAPSSFTYGRDFIYPNRD